MKILLYAWGGFNEDVLELNLKKLEFEVVTLKKECKDYTADGELASEMIKMINLNAVEAVISFNFFPIVSLVCDTCKIPYFSWVYDAPHATLYSKTAVYSVNQIGIFDRRLVNLLHQKGVSGAYHAPLAVDTEILRNRCTEVHNNESATPAADISFVGSMYTDDTKVNMYDMYRQQALENGEDISKWNELDEIVNSYCFNYSKDFIDEDISEVCSFLKKYMERNAIGLGDNFIDCYEEIIRENLLEKKVTVLERQQLMNAIAEHSIENDYKFHLYTSSDTRKSGILHKFNKGIVQYNTLMPKVFNRSRINLHITLRSIHTGMPLRVLDIMGCGGFLLSNAQEELLEYFDDGIHCVTYNSKEECLDKIDYYLSHESERKNIALAGYERVRDYFNYEQGLMRLFGIE